VTIALLLLNADQIPLTMPGSGPSVGAATTACHQTRTSAMVTSVANQRQLAYGQADWQIAGTKGTGRRQRAPHPGGAR
jgi:hypothetical protein